MFRTERMDSPGSNVVSRYSEQTRDQGKQTRKVESVHGARDFPAVCSPGSAASVAPETAVSERDCVVEGCLIILFRKVGISEAAEKLRRETWVDHRFETSQQRLAIKHD